MYDYTRKPNRFQNALLMGALAIILTVAICDAAGTPAPLEYLIYGFLVGAVGGALFS